jgi:DnaJ-class molecular chaperone
MSRRLEPCYWCEGTGRIRFEESNMLPVEKVCSRCKGGGKLLVDVAPPVTRVCTRCGGLGRLFDSISDGGLSGVFGELCPVCTDPRVPRPAFW